MHLFHEAGMFSYGVAIVFFVALVVAVRGRVEPVRAASVASVVMVALGLLGAGAGQRLVDAAVQSTTSLEERVLLLSIGTREAAANLLLSGVLVLLLLAIAGGVALAKGASTPR